MLKNSNKFELPLNWSLQTFLQKNEYWVIEELQKNQINLNVKDNGSANKFAENPISVIHK